MDRTVYRNAKGDWRNRRNDSNVVSSLHTLRNNPPRHGAGEEDWLSTEGTLLADADLGIVKRPFESWRTS